VKTLAVAVLTRGQTILYEGEYLTIERMVWRPGNQRALYCRGREDPVVLAAGAEIDVVNPDALQEVWG
jgi:hypothetical protein